MGQTPTYAPQKAMSARAKGGHLRPPLKCMTSEQFLCDVLHIGIGRLGLMCMQSKRLSADIIGDLHAHRIGHHYRSHSRGRSLGNSTRRKTVWHRFARPGQLDGNQDESPHRAVRRVLVRAKHRGRALLGLYLTPDLEEWTCQLSPPTQISIVPACRLQPIVPTRSFRLLPVENAQYQVSCMRADQTGANNKASGAAESNRGFCVDNDGPVRGL